MVNLHSSDMQISFLEKLAINFALPSDLVYHTLKSTFIGDQYSEQTIGERAKAMWQGKIDKYHKLLIIKDNHYGKIPDRVERISRDSPCGCTRLLLTYLREGLSTNQHIL